MATAFPLEHLEQSGAAPREAHLGEALRLYAQKVERDAPEHLRSLGMNAQDYATAMAEPGRTIEECVAAGLMSAEECRFIQGQATREDLAELGYSPEEIVRILEEQATTCASCD